MNAAKQLMEWIPVSERLPENFHDVLTCSSDGGIFLDFYVHEKNGFHNARWQERTITHWMPLPKPPKEVETHE